MLDIFRSDAFSVASLTDAINKAPYQAMRIGALGLFVERPISTTAVIIEEKDGRLALIQSTPRGARGGTIVESKRTARAFKVPHLQKDGSVLADQVQNVREFGSEDQTKAVQTVVNQELADLRAQHEVTLEHMRAGAIQGLVKDADGSTLFNLFTEFGVSQQTQAISLSGDIRDDVIAASRKSEFALGAAPITGFKAFCGDTFFDAFIESDAVKESLKYQESALLRTDVRAGFDYGGVNWENYRGRMAGADDVDPEDEGAGTPFFADDEAYLIPVGPSIFRTYFAPADFVETVNTLGLPLYAKQKPMDFDRGVEIHTQSNPLCLCLRPRAVVKLTLAS